MKRHVHAWIFFSALLVSTSALAVDIGYEEVRSLGMGGSLRSSVFATSALLINPGGIAMAKLYHTEALYMYQHPYEMHLVGGSVVDSITSMLGMGLGYYYRRLEKKEYKLQVHDARVGLALPIMNVAGIGVTLKYLNSKNSMHTDEDHPAPLGRKLNNISLDVGAQVRFLKRFTLGVVGYNLTKIDTPLAPMCLGMSAGVQLGNFQASFDALLDWSTYDKMAAKYMVGAEYFLINHIPLRAGYSYNDGEKSHYIHGGIGYISRVAAAEAAIVGEVNKGTDKQQDIRFLVSIKYFVN